MHSGSTASRAFEHTPQRIRKGASLEFIDGDLVFREPVIPAFIRIDDIYEKTAELAGIIDICIGMYMPVNLQVGAWTGHRGSLSDISIHSGGPIPAWYL